MGTETMNGLNPDLLAAYDLEPSCLTLLGVMADWAREQGEDDVAEFLSFLREKGLCPIKMNDWGYGWWQNSSAEPPRILLNTIEGVKWGSPDREFPQQQLTRLLKAWLRLTQQQRQDRWKWERKAPTSVK